MDARDTLERLNPDRVDGDDRAGTETLRLHLERYEFAAQHALPGSVLDLACGVGYGTRLLADRRPDLQALVGVDLSPEAIDYAAGHYACDRVRYEQGDAMSSGGGGHGIEAYDAVAYDTIVSLETIEHLPDPNEFFTRLAALLKPGGVLIASVPTTPSVDLNPHHLHDFTVAGFRRLGARNGLVEIASQAQEQRVSLSDLWGRDRHFRRDILRPNLPLYYLRHPVGLAKRIGTTLRHGLANHYLTLVWSKTP